MRNEGYDEEFSVAVTGSSSIIGLIIPPSMSLIIYGILAQRSIGSLFIAGIAPGLIMGVGLMAMASYFAYKYGYSRGDWWALNDIAQTLFRAPRARGRV